jgi:glycosyltransferase involved in cell wall biosynthesis
MKLVTCAIICYNYGRFLKEAIESCLNQEKGDYELEIIVIDDGSTDNTADICKLYTNRIGYFYSENQGFGASLTKAVKYANGEFICLLDADDYFLPGKVNTIVNEFKRNDTLLFIYHDLAVVDEKGNVIISYLKGGSTSTHSFKKIAVLDLLPAYNEQFFYTLFLAGKGLHVKQKLTHYRSHSLSMSKPSNPVVWKEKLIRANVYQLLRIKFLMETPPFWANRSMLFKIYCVITSNINFIKMEIALNAKDNGSSFKYYFKYLYWNFYAKKFNIQPLKIGLLYFILRKYRRY